MYGLIFGKKRCRGLSPIHATIMSAVVILCCYGPPVLANVVWVGNPAAYNFGRQLGHVIGAQQQAAQAKGQINSQIQQARLKWRTTKENRREDAAIGEEFSNLLFVKDFYYLSLHIAMGVGSTHGNALNILTGGDLDNGIPELAQYAYRSWVDEIRRLLGAPGSGDLLFVIDESQLLSAILAAENVYEHYRQQRDLAEYVQAGLISEPTDLLASDGSLALIRERAVDLATFLYYSSKPGPRLQKLSGDTSSPKILQCYYGSAAYPRSYYFWKDAAPEWLDDVAVENDLTSPVAYLGPEGYTNCPPSMRRAQLYYAKAEEYSGRLNKELSDQSRERSEAREEAVRQQVEVYRQARERQREEQAAIVEQRKGQRESLAALKKSQQHARQTLQQEMKASGVDARTIRQAVSDLQQLHRQELMQFLEKPQ